MTTTAYDALRVAAMASVAGVTFFCYSNGQLWLRESDPTERWQQIPLPSPEKIVLLSVSERKPMFDLGTAFRNLRLVAACQDGNIWEIELLGQVPSLSSWRPISAPL